MSVQDLEHNAQPEFRCCLYKLSFDVRSSMNHTPRHHVDFSLFYDSGLAKYNYVSDLEHKVTLSCCLVAPAAHFQRTGSFNKRWDLFWMLREHFEDPTASGHVQRNEITFKKNGNRDTFDLEHLLWHDYVKIGWAPAHPLCRNFRPPNFPKTNFLGWEIISAVFGSVPQNFHDWDPRNE